MVDFTPEQLEELNEVLKQFPEHEREEKKQEIIAQFESQQNQPQQCPFCLMVEGKIKTTNVYEDQDFLAILEINPANPGHTLLFPKKHVTTLTDLSFDEQESFFSITRKIDAAMLNFSEGSSVTLSSGKVTGVKYPHLIFNVIPRVTGDEVFLTWKSKKATEEDLAKYQRMIVENIPKKIIEVQKAAPIDPDSLKEAFARLSKRNPR